MMLSRNTKQVPSTSTATLFPGGWYAAALAAAASAAGAARSDSTHMHVAKRAVRILLLTRRMQRLCMS